MKHPLVEPLRTHQTATIFAAIAALNQPPPKGAEPTMSDDQRFRASILLRGMSALLDRNDDLVIHLENATKAAR